jgi:hypothetical protein
VKYYTNAELYGKMVEDISRLLLSRNKGRPDDLGSKRRLNRTDPKSELTSRFERMENVKNFDVEKWYSFNFLFAESFK